MPYITFSRKLLHDSKTERASKHLSSLFDNCIIERRGAKSINDVVGRSNRKGFSKVIIISESSEQKSLALSLMESKGGAKGFRRLGYYTLMYSGKQGKITKENGNDDATEEFLKKARE